MMCCYIISFFMLTVSNKMLNLDHSDFRSPGMPSVVHRRKTVPGILC